MGESQTEHCRKSLKSTARSFSFEKQNNHFLLLSPKTRSMWPWKGGSTLVAKSMQLVEPPHLHSKSSQ